jgi:hypothetical protein
MIVLAKYKILYSAITSKKYLLLAEYKLGRYGINYRQRAGNGASIKD